MKSAEFILIEAARDNGSTWAEITTEYNKKFKEEKTPDSLRKKYFRECEKRYKVTGNYDLETAIKIIKNNPIKPTDLAKKLGLDIDGLEALLDDLQNSRSPIVNQHNMLTFDQTWLQPENKVFKEDLFSDGEWSKFGIVSDTHLCSIYEQIHALHEFYNICEQEKVKAMFHAGDMTAGNGNVYKGQYQELKIIGVQRQINYVASTYPEKDFPTYVIAGNHDQDAYKNSGVDIIEQISKERPDLQYLGQLGAFIEQDGLRIYLMHGDGGVPYARSYKTQKILEGFDRNLMPDIAIFGHWHIAEFIPTYKGTIAIQPGCFEGQTPYLKRKGLFPDIGGVILSVYTKEINGVKKILRSNLEFVDFGEFEKGGKVA